MYLSSCSVCRTPVVLVVVTTLLAACAKPPPGGDGAAPDTAGVATTAPAAARTVEELEAVVAENPLKEAHFGETHVHTSYSLDAYVGGIKSHL